MEGVEAGAGGAEGGEGGEGVSGGDGGVPGGGVGCGDYLGGGEGGWLVVHGWLVDRFFSFGDLVTVGGVLGWRAKTFVMCKEIDVMVLLDRGGG